MVPQVKEVSLADPRLVLNMQQCNPARRNELMRTAAQQAGINGLRDSFRIGAGTVTFLVPSTEPDVNIQTFTARLVRSFSPVPPRPYSGIRTTRYR